jgi:virginiamycin B lyase
MQTAQPYVFIERAYPDAPTAPRAEGSTPASRRRRRSASPSGALRLGLILAVALAAYSATARIAMANSLPGSSEAFILEGASSRSPIALGFEGSIWFGEPGAGFEEQYVTGGVGRMSSLGLITGDFRNPSRATPSCPEPDACYRPIGGIALAPNHDIWFTEHGIEDYGTSFIGRVTTFGAVETFPISREDPPLGRNPGAIALGSDGNMWFLNPDSEPYARPPRTSAIGRVTPSGEITEFPLPENEEPVGGIVQGADGKMWFLANEFKVAPFFHERTGHSSIGYITPSGKVSLIPLPAESDPSSVALGAEGDVWFVAPGTHRISKVTPEGAITEYPVREIDFESVIAPGPDGNMWFTASLSPGALGRITPEGDVTIFPDVTPGGASPLSLTAGDDGTFWFTAEPRREGVELVRYVVPYVPTIETSPAIVGDPIVGRTVETSNGVWAHSPTAFAYQWLACDEGGSSCVAIPGSAGKTYAMGQGDAGRTLRVLVTATGPGGLAQAQSAPTAVVQSPSAPTRAATSAKESPVVPTTITWSFSAARKFTKVLALQLRSLPIDSSVEVHCAVHACTFNVGKARLSGDLFVCGRHSCRAGPLRHAQQSLTLSPLFRAKRLAVRTRLTVRVVRSGWQGKLFAFTMLAARDPRPVIDCLSSSSGASHPC